MKFKNEKDYDICWRGIKVSPGETVEDKPKKKITKEVKEDGVD